MKHLPFSVHPPRARGFTLVEIMIVVAIIALLAAMALPSLARARQVAQRTRLLKLVKATAEGFEMYEADNQKLPLETSSSGLAISQPYVVPTGMDLYLPKNNTWKSGTDGTWYWLYWPQGRPGYKGDIYLYNPTLTDDDVLYIDQKIDDGNTSTGSLINYSNTGLVYSIQ